MIKLSWSEWFVRKCGFFLHFTCYLMHFIHRLFHRDLIPFWFESWHTLLILDGQPQYQSRAYWQQSSGQNKFVGDIHWGQVSFRRTICRWKAPCEVPRGRPCCHSLALGSAGRGESLTWWRHQVFCIPVPLWWESTSDYWIPFTNDL